MQRQTTQKHNLLGRPRNKSPPGSRATGRAASEQLLVTSPPQRRPSDAPNKKRRIDDAGGPDPVLTGQPVLDPPVDGWPPANNRAFFPQMIPSAPAVAAQEPLDTSMDAWSPANNDAFLPQMIRSDPELDARRRRYDHYPRVGQGLPAPQNVPTTAARDEAIYATLPPRAEGQKSQLGGRREPSSAGQVPSQYVMTPHIAHQSHNNDSRFNTDMCEMSAVVVQKYLGVGKEHRMLAVSHPTVQHNFVHKARIDKSFTPMPLPPDVSVYGHVPELGPLVAIGWLRLCVEYASRAKEILDVYVVGGNCPEFSEFLRATPRIGRSTAQTPPAAMTVTPTKGQSFHPIHHG